ETETTAEPEAEPTPDSEPDSKTDTKTTAVTATDAMKPGAPAASTGADSEEVDLSQFAQKAGSDQDEKQPDAPITKPAPKKDIIKNSSGIGNMLKMVFITLAVFAATVAIGIGVGLGLLSVANNGTTPAPTPTPTVEEP